jgi:hypothetical protein
VGATLIVASSYHRVLPIVNPFSEKIFEEIFKKSANPYRATLPAHKKLFKNPQNRPGSAKIPQNHPIQLHALDSIIRYRGRICQGSLTTMQSTDAPTAPT